VSMIPDEVIEQVRDAADLVGIVGETVQLRRTGTDYRGPCPFHGGTHRNFAVIPKKGMYYCFVCHEGGDVFTWLMKRQGLDYPSAVREVARRAGIPIPESRGPSAPDPREPLYQAVALAQEFYGRQLHEAEEARVARDYLAGRDVATALAGEWGLGYAPRGSELREHMQQLGVEEAVLLEAGLLHRREDGSVGVRFRGRLLFPIHDVRGRAVGFGGRLLGPGEPKYLNSPDTPIFRKGGLLYHLYLAKGAVRREETVLVVEGYFDVLRLHVVGVEHVVAPLGTALTADQAAVLRRYAKTAVLFYDSDRAGLRATFRAGDELLRHGVRVRVATLPPDEDPDTLARKGGAAAVQALLRDAMDLLERKLQLLEQHGWLDDLQRKREALDRLLPTLRAPADPVVRDLYTGRVAEYLGIARDTLEREIRARPAAVPIRSPAGPGPADRATSVGPGGGGGGRGFGTRTEERLLRLLLASPEWRTRARSEVSPEWFGTPASRSIFTALAGLDPAADSADAAAALPEFALPVFDRLRESAGELRGMDVDAEYVTTSDKLRGFAEIRRLGTVGDFDQRRRIIEGWTPETKQLYAWLRRRSRRSSSTQD
jgi:DNA primase